MSLTNPLSTEADILRRVDQTISADDMRHRGLWVFFLDRYDTQMPVVVPIDDVPDHPDLPLVGNVCWIVSRVLAEHEPEGSAVIALSRPGHLTPVRSIGTGTWRSAPVPGSTARRSACSAWPRQAASGSSRTQPDCRR